MRQVSAYEFAAELAAAADVRDDVVDAAVKSGNDIRQDWMDHIPDTPGGYQGAGFSGSPGANRVEVVEDPMRVGAEVYNQSFVVGILQAGTPSHGPKVDLFGVADPHIDQFVEDVEGEVGL